MRFRISVKILAGIYVSLLAVIVFLADRSDTAFVFRSIKELPFGDKIGHLLLMGGFSFLLNLALNARRMQIRGFKFLLGTAIVLSIVTLEEFSQIFVPGRTFDLMDLAADFAGIAIFGKAAERLLKRFLAAKV